eukprot:Nk52_evm1s1272 gene=Nk52_evmTU1s1272
MAYHFEPMLTRMRKEVAHRSNKENGATLLKPSAVTLGKAALYNNSQADSTHELESFVDNMELLYQHNIPISEWSGLLVDKLTVLTRNMIAGIPPIEKQEILSCPVNIYLLMLQCRYRQVDREYVYFTKLNLIRKEEDSLGIHYLGYSSLFKAICGYSRLYMLFLAIVGYDKVYYWLLSSITGNN